MNTPSLLTVKGPALEPWLEQLAQLRITVFREFPYLYDGSMEYEKRYLQTYVESDSAVCVLALDGERVVGASTGLAMSDETPAFRQPFEAAGMDTGNIFYCAESILLPQYRGGGVYREFFSRREAHARDLHKSLICFCAVQRPAQHPLKPADYVSLDTIWEHFGYAARPELNTRFSWKDIGESEESDKPMQFYLKNLN